MFIAWLYKVRVTIEVSYCLVVREKKDSWWQNTRTLIVDDYSRTIFKVLLAYSYLQVSVVADSVNISGQSNAVQFKVPECRLSDDLGSLFDCQKFSDVTLSVGGKEFLVHKAILAGTFCTPKS